MRHCQGTGTPMKQESDGKATPELLSTVPQDSIFTCTCDLGVKPGTTTLCQGAQQCIQALWKLLLHYFLVRINFQVVGQILSFLEKELFSRKTAICIVLLRIVLIVLIQLLQSWTKLWFTNPGDEKWQFSPVVTGVWCFLVKMKSNRSEKRSTKPHKPMESQNAHSPAHPSQGFRSHPTPNAHFHACTAMVRVQVPGKVQNRFHTVREMLQPSLELCSACLSETSFPGSSNSFYSYDMYGY